MQKEQRIQQQTFILIIIVIVLGLLYYLYHRKNKLYLSIVKQNQEAIKRETELNRRIKRIGKPMPPPWFLLPKNMLPPHSPTRKV